MDNVEIHDLFMEQARLVWNNSELLSKITVNVSVDSLAKSMALSTKGTPRAIGSSVYQMAREYTLHVNPNAFSYDKDRFVRTLRHEAIHLGHMRHTEDFFRLAKSTGATITGANEKGFGYQVQVQMQKGGRFELVKKFDDQNQANKYLYELADNFRKTGRKFSAMRVQF